MRGIFLLFLFCLAAPAAAQTFDVRYEPAGEVIDLSVERDGNGCIVTGNLLGNTWNSRLHRMALDSIGQLRWTTDWCDTVTTIVGHAIAPAWGTGFVHCSTDGLTGNWLLFRTDGQGSLVWQKALQPPPPYFIIGAAQSVIRVMNGYVFACDVQTNVSRSFIQLIKTDTSGNLIWARFLNKSDQKDYHHGLTECTNHDIVTACERVDNVNNTGLGIVVTRVDSSGNLRWSYFLAPANHSYPVAVTATPDNGVVVAGFTYSGSFANAPSAMLVKMDSTGVIQWAKTYSVAGPMAPRELLLTANNNLIVACETNSYIALFQTDNSGTLLWSNGQNAGVLCDAALVPGGIVLCARSWPFPADSIIVMRTDSFGRSHCNDVEFAPLVAPLSLSTYPAPFDSVVTLQPMVKVFPELHHPMTASYQCLSPVGVNAPAAENTCTVFPVPANGQVQVRNAARCTHLELYAGDGQCVWSSTPESEEVTICTETYAPGLYLLRAFLNDGQVLTRKIIIAR